MFADEEIKDWLITWFKNNTNKSYQEILNKINVNYFEEGWLDSFKFITFIMDIESSFSINFANDEFQNRDFSTINGLVKIISSRIKVAE